jgi:hypothetical protein
MRNVIAEMNDANRSLRVSPASYPLTSRPARLPLLLYIVETKPATAGAFSGWAGPLDVQNLRQPGWKRDIGSCRLSRL